MGAMEQEVLEERAKDVEMMEEKKARQESGRGGRGGGRGGAV
jgi:hypothetical protein